jgi:hypothetical protein
MSLIKSLLDAVDVDSFPLAVLGHGADYIGHQVLEFTGVTDTFPVADEKPIPFAAYFALWHRTWVEQRPVIPEHDHLFPFTIFRPIT